MFKQFFLSALFLGLVFVFSSCSDEVKDDILKSEKEITTMWTIMTSDEAHNIAPIVPFEELDFEKVNEMKKNSESGFVIIAEARDMNDGTMAMLKIEEKLKTVPVMYVYCVPDFEMIARLSEQAPGAPFISYNSNKSGKLGNHSSFYDDPLPDLWQVDTTADWSSGRYIPDSISYCAYKNPRPLEEYKDYEIIFCDLFPTFDPDLKIDSSLTNPGDNTTYWDPAKGHKFKGTRNFCRNALKNIWSIMNLIQIKAVI